MKSMGRTSRAGMHGGREGSENTGEDENGTKFLRKWAKQFYSGLDLREWGVHWEEVAKVRK